MVREADDELDGKDALLMTCCANDVSSLCPGRTWCISTGPQYPFSAPLLLFDRLHGTTTRKGTRRSAAVFLGNRTNLGGDTGPEHERITVPKGDAQQLGF